MLNVYWVPGPLSEFLHSVLTTVLSLPPFKNGEVSFRSRFTHLITSRVETEAQAV